MRLDLIFSRQAERQYKSLFRYLKKKAGLAIIVGIFYGGQDLHKALAP